MNVAAQQYASGYVRGVVVAGAQALERGFLVAERGQEGERELRRVKGLKGQVEMADSISTAFMVYHCPDR